MMLRIELSICDASVLLEMLEGLVMSADRICITALASPRPSQRWDESHVMPGIREGKRKVSTRYSKPPLRASSDRFLVEHARTMWWKSVGMSR